jgi:hypothetical protein
VFLTKTAKMLFISLFMLFGCAQSLLSTNENQGGVLAIPVRIHADVKADQFVLLEGSKPFPFQVKVYPIYTAEGTVRPKGPYDDFTFSTELSPGLYEIDSYRFQSKSNTTILTFPQQKSSDLLNGNAKFEILEGQITMLDRILQITGGLSTDRSLKHWAGENIDEGAFQDFTTFLAPGEIDNSTRVWRWLNFREGEYQKYTHMLNVEKSSEYWNATLGPKEILLDQDVREIDRLDNIILYSNGTIEDKESGLMWAGAENGFDLTWHVASKYCENYSAGGYTDWRLPSADELSNLYESQVFGGEGVVELIRAKNVFLWTSEKRIAPLTKIFSGAGLVNTANGKLIFFHPVNKTKNRVLPVRTNK